MAYSKILTVAALTVAALSACTAAPQPEKSDMSNEIIPSGGFVSKNGEAVSASWGGFQASAALADDGSATVQAGGPGLNSGASYGANGVQAGAGAYGQNAHAGLVNGDKKPAVVGGYVDQKPGSGGYGNGQLYHQNGAGAGNGFFDRIFAIPINVLQSVNTYLNQKQNGHSGVPAAGPQANLHNKMPEQAGADYGHQSGAAASSGQYAGAAASSGQYAGAAASSGHGSPMMIPISALRSVQNLLNG